MGAAKVCNDVSKQISLGNIFHSGVKYMDIGQILCTLQIS